MKNKAELTNKYYCTICGKSTENSDVENLEIKNDDGILSLTLIRLRCNCNNKLQTIRIYNDDNTTNKDIKPTA